jgi:predicted ATPase/DNA-binding winged helix-turn-helix (wHTH) protein
MPNNAKPPETRSPTSDGDAILFGGFCLVPSARTLKKGGQIVPVGDRALDILIALVDRAGLVVSKADLFEIVWPQTSIEESALRVHIAALRKVLGDRQSGKRMIISIRARGYAFVAETQRVSAGPREPTVTNDQERAAAPLVRIVGREEILTEIADELPRKRLVTITGTGGIGKTVVALAVLRKLANFFRDGVQLLDLASLTRAELVAPHLASLLRLPAPDKQPLNYLIAHIQSRQMLIVFDNCEHVIETVSPIVEAILTAAPEVYILATSREPLRVLGEWVYRLVPLSVPPASSSLTAAEALQFPAVQLFAERARASGAPWVMTDVDAPVVAEICARLDGLPLAIELAAARHSLFGLRGLADRLDNRFHVLTKGRRTAPPRHQTLTAMIDWSYANLNEEERIVWRRFAAFPASFSIEAANSIARFQPSGRSTIDILDGLVEKSLVTAECRDDQVRYRLLETLRLYALEKLRECGEAEQLRRQHAEYWYSYSINAGRAWAETPTAGWVAEHSSYIADLRVALEWALTSGGDPGLGIKIVAASARLWFSMLLLPELRRYLELAIILAPRFEVDAEIVMRLHIALAISVFHTDGTVSAVRHALDHALAIAERRNDVNSQLEIIWTHCRWSYTHGDYSALRTWLDRIRHIVAKSRSHRSGGAGRPDAPSRSPWSASSWWRPELPLVPLYDRIAAFAHHLWGEQQQALWHAERARAAIWRTKQDGSVERDHEHDIAMRQHYARILWVMGRADEAWQIVRGTIDIAPGRQELTPSEIAEASTTNRSVALGFFLVYAACPISFWIGDLDAAERCLSLLVNRESGIDFHFWQTVGHLYERVLDSLKRLAHGATGVRAGLTNDGELIPIHADTLSTFHWKLLCPQSLNRAMGGDLNWCTAEVLRAQGEMLLNAHNSDDWSVEELFLRSIDISRQQKALSWELRSATSLARLWHGDGRTIRARSLLSEVYGRFTQGFTTKDLVEAKELLSVLG